MENCKNCTEYNFCRPCSKIAAQKRDDHQKQLDELKQNIKNMTQGRGIGISEEIWEFIATECSDLFYISTQSMSYMLNQMVREIKPKPKPIILKGAKNE